LLVVLVVDGTLAGTVTGATFISVLGVKVALLESEA
jgi:hypothetical protein